MHLVRHVQEKYETPRCGAPLSHAGIRALPFCIFSEGGWVPMDPSCPFISGRLLSCVRRRSAKLAYARTSTRDGTLDTAPIAGCAPAVFSFTKDLSLVRTLYTLLRTRCARRKSSFSLIRDFELKLR